MNLPKFSPPPRNKTGTPPALTPMQQIDAWSWFKAKRYLGSYKSKAKELGVTVSALRTWCERAQRREDQENARLARGGQTKRFERDVESLPY